MGESLPQMLRKQPRIDPISIPLEPVGSPTSRQGKKKLNAWNRLGTSRCRLLLDDDSRAKREVTSTTWRRRSPRRKRNEEDHSATGHPASVVCRRALDAGYTGGL